MKRNNLKTAVLAGITGLAGIASVSNAVNFNSDGVGQVLIYPYYTVNNGLNTLISVVNTTDRVKAIKVRFLEGKNSREVLDFNLYMSAYDVWTAALIPVQSTAAAVGADFADQNSVKLLTGDTSCTVPAINGQEFLPFAFSGLFDDTLVQNMSRATEGHFEMIEMGEVINDDAVAATHVAGTPADCQQLVDNWTAPGGQWVLDPSFNIVDPDGSGGLFGSTSLVDVAEGVDFAYNADAFQAYSTAQQHANPGDLLPNLGTGSSSQSIVFNNGQAITTDWLTSSVEAISASYMHKNLYGEYALDAIINAKTEWVVTFPTKAFYVDPIIAIGLVPVAPFEKVIVEDIGACEEYGFVIYDREEMTPTAGSIPPPPSPLPPGVNPNIPVFCWETNVLEFNREATAGDSLILGSNNTTHLVAPYDNGWLNLSFNQSTSDGVSVPGGVVQTYDGLPVTGFAVQKYTNAGAADGLLAQYGGLFAHRGLKNITSN
jgi:hypothetical protein